MLRPSSLSLRTTLRPLSTFLSLPPKRSSSSIRSLQAAFRDPSSPFHIPPGQTGPSSPDDPPTPNSNPTAQDAAPLTTLAYQLPPGNAGRADNPHTLEQAQECLREWGYDPQSFWEQRIVWGDHDAFQHVNNVRYARFFESSRITWMMSLGEELGGPERARAMINAQGISLILKSIEVQFKRIVTFPDTLLIGYRPLPSPPSSSERHEDDGSTFNVSASAFSLKQGKFVAHSKEALVWYNYDTGRKCDPGEEAKALVKRRMGAQGRRG